MHLLPMNKLTRCHSSEMTNGHRSLTGINTVHSSAARYISHVYIETRWNVLLNKARCVWKWHAVRYGVDILNIFSLHKLTSYVLQRDISVWTLFMMHASDKQIVIGICEMSRWKKQKSLKYPIIGFSRGKKNRGFVSNLNFAYLNFAHVVFMAYTALGY